MGLYDDEIYAEYAVENEKLKKQVETLRAAMHDIYEVYAGSEGIPRPETCSEAYLYDLVMGMARIAAKHKRAAALKENANE